MRLYNRSPAAWFPIQKLKYQEIGDVKARLFHLSVHNLSTHSNRLFRLQKKYCYPLLSAKALLEKKLIEEFDHKEDDPRRFLHVLTTVCGTDMLVVRLFSW